MVATLLAVLLGLGGVYAVVVSGFFVAQRSLQYLPPKDYVPPRGVGLEGVEEHHLETADGERVMAWWRPPPAPDRPVALYFHGNAETLWHLAGRIERLAADGFGVTAATYRSYPGSTGKPTEPALVADAARLHDFVTARGVAPRRIVSVGYSLGTGVAVALAKERPVAALVLYAPFTSAAAVARRVYPFLPVRRFMHDQFRSDERLAALDVPVAVVHGTADGVVPFHQGRTLHDLAPGPKLFVALEGVDHVLAADAGRDAVLAFLSEHLAAPGRSAEPGGPPASAAREAAGEQ